MGNSKGSEKMEVKFTCKKCSEELHENPSSVLKEEQQFNGQKIEVMYYICPVCSSKNYVQADNEHSKEWLSKCIGITKIQMSANRAGRRGKQSGKIKKAQIHLRKIRNELQKELENAGYNFVECEVCNGDKV